MKLALINIKQLVTVPSGGRRFKAGKEMASLGCIENAAVLIENDQISWIGRMEELTMSSLGETDVLDCLECVVMPGFVDSHTHTVFAGSREEEFAMRSAGASYQEIAERGGGILRTVQAVRETPKKELKKNARKWMSAMLLHGTTTVEIKSGYGLDTENEIKLLEAIRELDREEVMTVATTFLGAHAVPPEYLENKQGYLDTILNNMLPYIGSKQLASFCDVFCEEGYFNVEECRSILLRGRQFGLLPKIHADELSPLGGAELAAEIGAVSADHLEQVSGAGVAALAKAGVVAVLLPGVSFFLHHGYAPARALIDAGVPVALATDFNPGSCMTYSMPLIMTIACTQMGMLPEEAITASTLNAAAALNLSHERGSIEVGKKADAVVLRIPDYRFLPYHFGENHVEKVVKDGVVLELR
jgi:imidazolonepropionase